MAIQVAHDPAEQRRRRKRLGLSQTDVRMQFVPAISLGSISDYENEKSPLPYEFTGADYEAALARALLAKGEAK